MALIPSPASAQAPLIESPGETRPELPPFEQPPAEPGLTLPRVPLPEEPDLDGLAAGRRVFVREVRITGSSVFDGEELAEITAPFEGRSVSFAEIQALRDRVTLAYIERGYVTSGATVARQALDDGVLELRVVEGALGAIDVQTDGRLRDPYVRERLRLAVGDGPVNVYRLEKRLRLLQQDERISSIEAQLLPGETRGESRLEVQVSEANPFLGFAQADNWTSPSIGSAGGRFRFDYSNVTGWADAVTAEYRVTAGLHAVYARYFVFLNPHDTGLALRYRGNWGKVVEELSASGDTPDITSNTQTAGFQLSHPVYRTLESSLVLSITGEYRRSQSFLEGEGFPFAPGVSDDGVAKVSVVRLGQDWVHRTREQVFAVRSRVSVGLPILGATENSDGSPDGEFVAWLAQAQWARRFGFLDSQLVVRGDLQLSSSPLLGLEQLAIGGHSTVRGYRENELVRDNGVIGSIEARIPVLSRPRGLDLFMELAPFFDYSYSWNTRRPAAGPGAIGSVGIGARIRAWGRVGFDAYWGYALEKTERIGARDTAQDHGFSLALRVIFP